ncbi:hypothetical protein POVCU1_070930 [Plasmodium ovale curtisi]|uniref:Uncharacterized protein n=1 Tax=Plasmodium ovale curtisi TaxID=864141 RepID=A0A1A8XB98_PLAOA|nr:hypothetical protein POVCU1_070930 [Plasmodium ovale curtisi]
MQKNFIDLEEIINKIDNFYASLYSEVEKPDIEFSVENARRYEMCSLVCQTCNDLEKSGTMCNFKYFHILLIIGATLFGTLLICYSLLRFSAVASLTNTKFDKKKKNYK